MTEMQARTWAAVPPKFVAGSDEVGYGALAGPLVVCAVCAPYSWSIPGLADSKALTENARYDLTAQLYVENRANRLRIQLVQVDSWRIDELGVQTALRKAHDSALSSASADVKGILSRSDLDLMLVADGDLILPGSVVSLPKADTFVPQVMAASIVAKHVRDGFMKDMAEHFPGYGFERNVGYGTKEHYAAIEKLGPCSLHRKSYAPFRENAHACRDGEYNQLVQEAHGEPSQGQRDTVKSDQDVHPKRRTSNKPKRKADS